MSNIELAGRASDTNIYSQYFKKNYEVSGSPKGYNLEALVKDPQGNIEDIIALSKYYYHKNGLIMRTVNIIRDFGVGEPILNYPTKNKNVKKVVEAFNKRINIRQVLEDMMFELVLSGNCAGYNRNGKRIDIYPITKVEVSPLIVKNKPILLYKNEESFDDNYDITPEMQKNLNRAYPPEIANGIKNNVDKIQLNVKNTFFLKVNSSRYEPYGVTFLLPAFDELGHKNLLKEAEKATATGIIEKILRISVGDKDHAPTQPEINFYDNLIAGKKGSLKVTVPYFVDFNWIEPDTQIFGEEKFTQVDKDLLSALGVSLTLIRGEGGGNYSEGVISIAGLIKTIEGLRGGIPAIVEEWYMDELKRNNLPETHCPKVELPKIEIDNSSRIEMVQWLFEHAGLPYEIMYDECGYDYTSIKLMRESENETEEEETFKLRQQPFQGQGDAGRPQLNQNKRKTDKSKSNNENPRTDTVKKSL